MAAAKDPSDDPGLRAETVEILVSGAGSADVREALTGLGYGTDEVRDVLRDLSGDADAPSLLREALKSLGARRA